LLKAGYNQSLINGLKFKKSMEKPPKSWLLESILVTLFCCLPFGIVGIIQASKVESRWYAGDHDGSEYASAEAAKWTKIGFFVGIATYVVSVAMSVLGVFGSLMTM
jgi:Interferon-induced transmembrane protein